MKILIVALSTARRRATLNEMEFLLDHGINVTLVTSRLDPWEDELDPRVTVLTLAEAEGRHPLPRTERAVVFRAPRLVFMSLRRALRRLAKIRGGSRPARLARSGTDAAERGYTKLANAFHLRVFNRLYRNLRPVILWRVARKYALAGIDVGAVDLILVQDSQSIPIGWHLAREYPRLDVTFSLDREKIAAAAGTPAVPATAASSGPAGPSPSGPATAPAKTA
jgi:hypothetical protein